MIFAAPWYSRRVRWLVIVAVLAACRSADPQSSVEKPPPPPAVKSEKHAALDALLARGPVTLTLDTRRDGVVVPARHQSDARMMLVVRPDADPKLDDTALTTTLTERGQASRVVVPLPAIYRAVGADGRETAWEHDRPKDLVDNFIDEITPVPTTEPKLATIAAMLEIRESRIYLDARRKGVVVPAGHRGEPDLVLRIGRHLSPPIPDLELDDFGVTGTLAFDGKSFAVRVPWDAIYAAVIEGYARGVEWVADVPDAARTHMPAEVTKLVERWEMCWHFSGEEPYDAARRAQIAEGVAKWCPGNDAERERLRVKWQADPAVRDALHKLDEMK